MAKFCVAWTERYERIIERPSIEEAAQHARFAVAQKPNAVLLSVELIEESKDAGSSPE